MNFFYSLLCYLIFFKNHQLISSVVVNVYPKLKSISLNAGADCGDPLFLTPYLESGRIKEAREKSEVSHHNLTKLNVKSYSGYLTIDKKYNSNTFFWYFPSQYNPENAPVLLWLQGGPGASSLFGLFTENGPIMVDSKINLLKRKYSWNLNHNVIYIDNPVGTGYSFTDSDAGYSTNDLRTGENLLIALIQFFTLFPELQKNEFYLTGESYAGKYIPALGYVIKNYNNKAGNKLKINLKGLAIGNGYTDPGNMLLYSDYLYQIGLIDSNGRKQFKAIEDKGRELINQNKYDEANIVLDSFISNDSRPSLFRNVTGFDSHYNYLRSMTPKDEDWMSKWIQKEEVRKIIHVGNRTFHTDPKKVVDHLAGDQLKSVAPYLAQLLDEYRILLYNGQLDIICAYPLMVNYILKMNWSGAEEYKKAMRKQWWLKDQLAGYTKKVGNLTEILIRNAGHMVPTDQPLWAWDMITRFTHRKEF